MRCRSSATATEPARLAGAVLSPGCTVCAATCRLPQPGLSSPRQAAFMLRLQVLERQNLQLESEKQEIEEQKVQLAWHHADEASQWPAAVQGILISIPSMLM